MNIKEFQEKSSRTFAHKDLKNEDCSSSKTLVFALEDNCKKLDLLHCAIGASTETGELLDAFKKSIYYNRPLDVVNVGEEIADTLWYLTNLCRLLNLDIEKLMDNNIAKLQQRYPEKFTEEAATNRNLEAERKILEQ